jgi:NADPH2:quinone reductase
VVPDGVDVVMHLAGDFSVLDALREGGRFVSTLVMSAEQVPTQSAIVVPVFANPTGDVLDRAATAQVRGVATVTVQRVFPLEQADEALAVFAAGTLGKIVISID